MAYGKRLVVAALVAVLIASAVALVRTADSHAYTISVPTTSVELTPAANSLGWGHAPVTLTFTVQWEGLTVNTGAESGGVTGDIPLITYYRFGGAAEDPTGYSTYDPANKPVVSTEGSTVVWFYSVGMPASTGETVQIPLPVETPKSVTVNLDTTAPTTTATVDPTPNAKGINTTGVTVTLAAIDALSGVDKTYYRLGDSGDFAEYAGPFAVSAEGTTNVSFYSTDKAGGAESPKSVAVVIDRTPPKPKPLKGYSTVVASPGGSSSPTANGTLRILRGGHTIKTVALGTQATNRRLKARFTAPTQPGVYRYRILAKSSSGLKGKYIKGRLAVGDRPSISIQGAAGVNSGQLVSVDYILVDPYAATAHLKLQIMLPAKAGSGGGSANANKVVKSFDLGTRKTNALGTATFRCTVDPGLYRWAFSARDSIGATLRSASNLVWVY